MEYTSIRQFYLDNSKPDSCNYCYFTRKIKKLEQELGVKSGVQKISSTFTIIDLSKSEMYKELLVKRKSK